MDFLAEIARVQFEVIPKYIELGDVGKSSLERIRADIKIAEGMVKGTDNERCFKDEMNKEFDEKISYMYALLNEYNADTTLGTSFAKLLSLKANFPPPPRSPQKEPVVLYGPNANFPPPPRSPSW